MTSHLFILGTILLATAWFVGRSARRGRRGNAVAAVNASRVGSRERSEENRLREMEVRLHDYGREVEGRMRTRLAMLDRLVREADNEISRLTRLLEQQRQSKASKVVSVKESSATSPDIILLPRPRESAKELADSVGDSSGLSAERTRLLRNLADAGYSPDELATLLDCPATAVRRALEDDRRSEAA